MRCKVMIESIEAGVHDDTKSSAGDKFETSREMMKQEVDKVSSQLSVLIDQKKKMKTLSNSIEPSIINHGSIVGTDKGVFYISVSLGKINYQDEKIYAISEQSPMALALLGRSKGDVIEVNNRSLTILAVYN